MALLTSNSLDGCSSIPCFLPGTTRLTFNNSTAPTSWTKDTTSHNNKALRLITGTRTPGGGPSSFTTVFPDTARPIQGSVSFTDSNVTFADETISPVAIGQFNSFPTFSINNGSVSSAQLPAHSHVYQRLPFADVRSRTLQDGVRSHAAPGIVQLTSDQTSQETSHGHLNAAGVQHNHPVTVTAHGHQITSLGPHNHGFAATAQNFAVSYTDIIVAVKDSDPVACSI